MLAKGKPAAAAGVGNEAAVAAAAVALATVGRRVESSQADDRRVIRLVRERPLLYTRNNMPVASYYSQVKLLWHEIAKEMGWTVAEVRRKWSHIRNSYSRHLRNEMHGAVTGKGRVVSKWYLADELTFLREHMATDTRPSAYTSYASSYLDMEMGDQTQQPEQVDIKPFIDSPWFSLATGGGHIQADPAGSHNDDSSGSHSEDNNVYFQFFRGIYSDYQELSSKKQRLFRRQCLQLLHTLLDEEENCPEAVAADEQSDAINLSSSSFYADNIKEQKVFCKDEILPN
ncbi:hypothetical protein K1T71_010011 [Dendrolimus kikuchii]|uniref:Uncharacterized protein n=1 Tax=Dendrolimus kikuchii TaxID=765133 RepID=A0ACC1CTC3_9NEOP|nr:hypothetical protein K1T71_010011 [Dendrolimus kikuchii]